MGLLPQEPSLMLQDPLCRKIWVPWVPQAAAGRVVVSHQSSAAGAACVYCTYVLALTGLNVTGGVFVYLCVHVRGCFYQCEKV